MSKLTLSKQEQGAIQWVKDNVEGKLIFMDIGANKGLYSESLLDVVSEKIEKLYCFEPVERHFQTCQEKFKDNDNITVFQKALSNENKESEFFEIIAPQNQSAEGLSSLNFRPVFEGFEHKKIKVDCVILQDFLKLEDSDYFIKIDAEGHELEILEGMEVFFEKEKVICIQFEYGDCILEKNKDLNDFIEFVSKFKNYTLCNFNVDENKFDEINETNIDSFNGMHWGNMFIIKK